MQVVSNPLIPEVKTIIPKKFGDARGWFVEQYNAERYRAAGIVADFVQDNESLSSKGVVRGLHWQAAQYAQAKLVRVIRGSVYNVAVDVRKGSPTFGRSVVEILTAENNKQVYIPRGFAHGVIVLEDDTLLSYKCDNIHYPESRRGLKFNDPALDIVWPELDAPFLFSEKDESLPMLKDIEPCESSDMEFIR